MSEFKVGDRVRVMDRPDWPSPPGYRWAGAEGVVTRVWYPDEPGMSHDFIEVQLDMTASEVDSSTVVARDYWELPSAEAEAHIIMTFRADALKKVIP